MSRRDQLRAAMQSVYQRQTAPKEEQKKSEKMCGYCKHYREIAYTGEGKGFCEVLKMGSDIMSEPPVYVLEGDNGYYSMNLADASKCKYYERMEFVDKDGTECNDPRYRRSMRQMQED
ncbi:MAG: hypothetical protein ACLFOY_14690 [Desulfatibacillaceae bacterium]